MKRPSDSDLVRAVAMGAATLVAAAGARALSRSAWRRVRGRAPSDDPEMDDISLSEAVLWAGVTGAAAVAARMVARRAVVRVLGEQA